MHLAGYVARAGHRPGQVPPGRKATPRPLTRLLRPLTAFTKSSRRRPGQAVLMLSSRSAMHSRGQSAASGNIVCISIYMCTLSPSSNSSSPWLPRVQGRMTPTPPRAVRETSQPNRVEKRSKIPNGEISGGKNCASASGWNEPSR